MQGTMRKYGAGCFALAILLTMTMAGAASAYIVLCPGWPVPCGTVVVCPLGTPQCDGHNQPCCLGSNSMAAPANFSNLTLIASPPSPGVGAPITLQSSVTWCSPSGEAPSSVTGSVAFLVNGLRDTTVVSSSALALNGTGAMSTAVFPAPGTYTLQAFYSGDSLVAGCWSEPVSVIVAGSASVGARPATFELSPPRPNPSSHGALLTIELPTRERIHAGVYDTAGRQVAVLADGDYPAGRYDLSWSGADARGQRPAGQYFVRVWSASGQLTRSVTLVR